jgi:hypothetical protein
VDSRKSVRDAQKLNESKLHLYIDPFSPDNFTKKFTKRETKKKESIEEDIQDNVEGLYSYLTAPNIRHKVKHPIFLCCRFASCISLYYNTNELTEPNKKNFVEYMQNLLYDDLDKLLITKENKIEESIFLMFINKEQLICKNKRKKILELLIPVKSKSLSVVFSQDEIPANFVKFTNLTEITNLYTKSYAKLIARSKAFNKDFEGEDEDGPDDGDNQSEHQVIDIAHNDASSSASLADAADFFGPMVAENPVKKIKSENPQSPPRQLPPQSNNSSAVQNLPSISNQASHNNQGHASNPGPPSLELNKANSATKSQTPVPQNEGGMPNNQMHVSNELLSMLTNLQNSGLGGFANNLPSLGGGVKQEPMTQNPLALLSMLNKAQQQQQQPPPQQSVNAQQQLQLLQNLFGGGGQLPNNQGPQQQQQPVQQQQQHQQPNMSNPLSQLGHLNPLTATLNNALGFPNQMAGLLNNPQLAQLKMNDNNLQLAALMKQMHNNQQQQQPRQDSQASILQNLPLLNQFRQNQANSGFGGFGGGGQGFQNNGMSAMQNLMQGQLDMNKLNMLLSNNINKPKPVGDKGGLPDLNMKYEDMGLAGLMDPNQQQGGQSQQQQQNNNPHNNKN